jgi:glutathione S-transferase
MALVELGLEAEYIEANPFSEVPDAELSRHTPFGRVPALRHGAFTLTETAAIVGYLHELTASQALRSRGPQGIARMIQVIGIVDAYGYRPMVKDVFSHGFYRPQMDEGFDPDKVASGLEESRPVLQTLEMIAQEGLQLTGQAISLADIHLAPMIDYFTKVPEAVEMLSVFPALSKWWVHLRERPSLILTDPFVTP